MPNKKCRVLSEHKCFANKAGICGILKDTSGYPPCPFYKTIAQYKRDYSKYGGIMVKINGVYKQKW